MPFKSEKQRRYMFANEPEIAKNWTNEHGGRRERLASGGVIKKARANKMKLADYSRMRAGGMISNGSLTPPKVEKFQDQVCRKASKGS